MTANQRPILIIGGSGRLGRSLLAELSSRQLPYSAPSSGELDLRQPNDVRQCLRDLGPRAVVNVAAYTAVGDAELPVNREAVYALNREAPGRLGRACAEAGIPLVHVSTDYVFDGVLRRPYREEDPVAPIQVYGQSKLDGEQAILDSGAESVIARVSTLYGPGSRAHYVGAVLRQAEQKNRIEVVRLPVSSPSYTPDIAQAIVELLSAGARGIVHVVNGGGCSRLELARTVVREAGFGQRVEVVERTDPPPPPRRPDYSVLDIGRYSMLTGRTIRPWDEALRDYLRHHAAG